MLQITVPYTEMYDEERGMFIECKSQTLQMEHSLVSISKWESEWHKPFFSREEKTKEEVIDYFKKMTLTPHVDPNVYECLTNENIEQINKYIDDPMTATTFSQNDNRINNREIVTSELIYYWMLSLNIPTEFQKWHINRLMTLIRVCEIKNQPPKKRSKREIMSRNAALNEARKNKYHTKG